MMTTANSRRLMEIKSPADGSFLVMMKNFNVFDWMSGGQEIYHQNFRSREYPPAANKEESPVVVKSGERGTKWAMGHSQGYAEGSARTSCRKDNSKDSSLEIKHGSLDWYKDLEIFFWRKASNRTFSSSVLASLIVEAIAVRSEVLCI